MLLNQLSLSYRCHGAIGNSLNLDVMMDEVLETFVFETDAIYGSFYLISDSEATLISSIGKEIEYCTEQAIQEKEEQKIAVCDFDETLLSLVYHLEHGMLVFIYDKTIDLDFVIPMYESFRKKLNVSIEACLNVNALRERNSELKQLSDNLQQEVNKAVLENKRKEKQIFEQLKMAQMGELIGNIAHQWRQPLSIISTASTGMKLKKELNILTDQDFFHYTDSIAKNVHFLSDTIDEFRDYINDSHQSREVIIQERVKMALKMVESSFEMDGIELIEEHLPEDPIFFRLIAGKLLQVLISIFNNAREALVATEQSSRWVKYAVYNNEYNVTITIEDNAGGIDEKIIDKVFNPYFTTKHQSQGTGIGLYTSYDIISNHLGGQLYVQNSEHGAKFFIVLPLNGNYVI